MEHLAPADPGPGPDQRLDARAQPAGWWTLAAGASAGAGLIHAAAAGSHQGDRSVALVFAAVALAQLAWGLWALLRPRRPVALIGAGVNLAAVLAWSASRLWGLPVVEGLAERHPIGIQDGLAAGLAVVAGVAAVAATGSGSGGRSHELLRRPAVLGVAGLGLAAASVAGMAAGHTHGPSHEHDHGHDEVAALDQHGHATGDVPASTAVDHEATHDHAADDGRAHTAVGPEPAPGSDEGGEPTPAHFGGTTHDHGDQGVPGTGGDAHHHDVDGHHHSDGVPGDAGHDHADPAATPAPIIALDDARVTEAERQAAQALLDTTTEAMRQFSDVASVQRAGYVSIGDGGTGYEHFVNIRNLADGRVLDPSAVESVVFRVAPDGTRELASAMYILEFGSTMADVPDVAGELTAWHDHQDLCWEGIRVVGHLVDGRCQRGEFRPTAPMLHVWLVPHPCGPFAGIEGHGEGCGDHHHGD